MSTRADRPNHLSERQRLARTRRQDGFTLLEVLVVVAIIAMLAAILLTSLSAAREQSRRMVCASNLRQIALAWHMYLDESKGRFPVGTNLNVNYGGLQGKGSQYFGNNPKKPVPKPLNRFLRLPTVVRTGGEAFICPSDSGLMNVLPTAWQYYGTSYYPNELLVGRQFWPVLGLPCSDVWNGMVSMVDRLIRINIDNESTVILSGDFSWYDTWNPKWPDRFPIWHQRRSMHNIAFMDGHGEFVRIRKGIYVDARYTDIPFKDIRVEFAQCQQEIPCQ